MGMTEVERAALEKLLERARRLEMSPQQQAAQRRSFAFGNAAFENPRITREMIAEEDQKQFAANE